MKKIIFSIFMTAFVLSSYATTASDFSYDQKMVESKLTHLNVLEAEVIKTSLTFTELKQGNSVLIANVAASPLAPDFSLEEMDWGSFAWGFLCCPVGFFVVAINKDKEQNQKTSYWIGVIVSTVLGAITTVASGVAGV